MEGRRLIKKRLCEVVQGYVDTLKGAGALMKTPGVQSLGIDKEYDSILVSELLLVVKFNLVAEVDDNQLHI